MLCLRKTPLLTAQNNSRNVLKNNEPLQRLLRFQRHRSSNCPDRGTEFGWRESPSRSPLPRSLQHHTEPVANICEKETRIVTHTVDGFEYREAARGLHQRLKRVSRITTLDAGVPGRTDGLQLLPAKLQWLSIYKKCSPSQRSRLAAGRKSWLC